MFQRSVNFFYHFIVDIVTVQIEHQLICANRLKKQLQKLLVQIS